MIWILLFLLVVIGSVVGAVLVYANNKKKIDAGIDKAKKVKDIIEGE